jgi:Copper type II ascorbate-dependent monooxygenase, C-terminal domain
MKTLALVLLGAVLTTACGSSSSSSSGLGNEPDSGSTTQSYTVTFGPIQVPAGVENTQCIVTRLGNTASIHVGQIHNLLGKSSHHMVLYKVNDTTEQTAPFNCQPFTDTLNPAKGNPLIISQKPDDLLALPQGVAFTLDANQMVRLEMHYINATAQATTLESTSTLTVLPDSEYQQDASFLFIGDLDISIPAMSKATVGPVYYPVPSKFATSTFFAITGHEHHWGTDVQIWTASSATDPGTPIYQIPNWSWSDPELKMLTPPLQVPSGGGFKFQCDWFNGSTSPVSFGESALDEMCFFWAYYYPSQGAEVCFHTQQGGGYDGCCPGSPLCAQLGN